MHATSRSHSAAFTLVELAAVVVIGGAVIAGISARRIVQQKQMAGQIGALNNAKHVMLGMMQFADEYGTYPDAASAKEVVDRTHSTLKLDGDTANDYFRQLLAAGILKSEEPFYVKTPYSPTRPDNNMEGDEALKAGEVGLGYIMNGTKSLSDENPGRIVLVSPLLDAAASGEFDPKVFKRNQAVLACLDGSVRFADIRADGKVVVEGGHTLLETGAETMWGTDIQPVIKVPVKAAVAKP